MSMYDPFLSFDNTRYQAAPKLPLQSLITLIKALSSRVPNEAPPYVKEAEEQMREAAIEAEQAMVIRLRETNAVVLAFDLALDNAIDNLFTLMRDRLRGWARYQRPGLDFLLEDPDYQAQLQAAREKAELAGKLLAKLFGDGNLNLLTRPWAEQAQLMRNVLVLIDQDELEDDLLEVSGLELLPIIRRVNVEYAAMVDRRATEASNSEADLRVERLKLQRHIVNYANLVLSLIKPGKPETVPVVEAALEPMITMRPAATSSVVAETELVEALAEVEADPNQDLPNP
jgi:hypothetical protein